MRVQGCGVRARPPSTPLSPNLTASSEPQARIQFAAMRPSRPALLWPASPKTGGPLAQKSCRKDDGVGLGDRPFPKLAVLCRGRLSSRSAVQGDTPRAPQAPHTDTPAFALHGACTPSPPTPLTGPQKRRCEQRPSAPRPAVPFPQTFPEHLLSPSSAQRGSRSQGLSVWWGLDFEVRQDHPGSC